MDDEVLSNFPSTKSVRSLAPLSHSSLSCSRFCFCNVSSSRYRRFSRTTYATESLKIKLRNASISRSMYRVAVAFAAWVVQSLWRRTNW